MSWINAAPLLLITLVACTQVEPTRINEQPLQTKREAKEIMLVNDGDLQVAADMWKRSGQSPLHIIATYGTGDKDIADRNAKTAANRLKALGVTEVTTETMPAKNTEVIAHMTSLSAGAASACTSIPGIAHLETGYDYQNYRLGCSVDDYMGKQVASTPDLEGRVPGQSYGITQDSQRAGNIVDGYRTGKQNPPMKGLVSSDIAEGN